MNKLFCLLFSLFLLFSFDVLADELIPLSSGVVSASSTYKSDSPSKAVDGDFGSFWNSGKFPSRSVWIQIDFGSSKSISKLHLIPEQSPSGITTHKIYVGNSTSNLILVNTITSDTSAGVGFDVPVNASGRYVRIVTTKGPSWVAWREIEAFQASNWLKYYGYFCSACFWVGNGSYIGATSDHANLVDITANDPLLLSKISEANSHGMKVILDVSSVYFNGKTLKSDHSATWDNLKDTISENFGKIAAFYVVDEPNRVGISSTNLKVVINEIKSDFASIPVAAIYDSETNNFSGVELFDWVGIDCYDNGSGSCYMFKDRAIRGGLIESRYKQFRKKIDVSRQRIILVPQAGIPAKSISTSAVERGLPNEADEYINVALSDPLVILVMPFIWQTFNDGSANWYGAESLPTLRSKFTYFGKLVTGK